MKVVIPLSNEFAIRVCRKLGGLASVAKRWLWSHRVEQKNPVLNITIQAFAAGCQPI